MSEITGQKILFDVEDIGEFEVICQVCDNKLFHSGDDRTVLYCVQCKTITADNKLTPRATRPANALIVDLKYDDGELVSFPMVCNCGYGGFVKAVDGSCLACNECMLIIAKPTFSGAFADVEGAGWMI
jgi:hypothetical protein